MINPSPVSNSVHVSSDEEECKFPHVHPMISYQIRSEHFFNKSCHLDERKIRCRRFVNGFIDIRYWEKKKSDNMCAESKLRMMTSPWCNQRGSEGHDMFITNHQKKSVLKTRHVIHYMDNRIYFNIKPFICPNGTRCWKHEPYSFEITCYRIVGYGPIWNVRGVLLILLHSFTFCLLTKFLWNNVLLT